MRRIIHVMVLIGIAVGLSACIVEEPGRYGGGEGWHHRHHEWRGY